MRVSPDFATHACQPLLMRNGQTQISHVHKGATALFMKCRSTMEMGHVTSRRIHAPPDCIFLLLYQT